MLNLDSWFASIGALWASWAFIANTFVFVLSSVFRAR
jgi:hypothetical protein